MLPVSNSYQQNLALQKMLSDPYFNQFPAQSMSQLPQVSEFSIPQFTPQSCDCNSAWQSAIGAIMNMFDKVMNIVMSLFGAQNAGSSPATAVTGQMPVSNALPGTSGPAVTTNSATATSGSSPSTEVHFLDKVKELVNKGKGFLSDGKEVFTDIQSAVKSGWETVSGWASGAWNTVKDWASTAISWIF